jgi:hypothetical protein
MQAYRIDRFGKRFPSTCAPYRNSEGADETFPQS